MKKILLAALVIIMFAAPMACAAETYRDAFPDTNFRNYVLGIVGGGKTSDSDVTDADNLVLAARAEVNVGYGNITDLTGIEYFTGLTVLLCHSNTLTSLDISKNTALVTLAVSGNQLKALDVSKHTALKDLNCANN
jgi:hypothetical protein